MERNMRAIYAAVAVMLVTEPATGQTKRNADEVGIELWKFDQAMEVLTLSGQCGVQQVTIEAISHKLGEAAKSILGEDKYDAVMHAAYDGANRASSSPISSTSHVCVGIIDQVRRLAHNLSVSFSDK